MRNFIFGYGSLVESNSRTRTSPNSKLAYPVEVTGLQRGWWARVPVPGLSTTFLGCALSDSDSTNGVIFTVSQSDLIKLDEREKGYQRILLNNTMINDYCNILNKEDKVWVYINSDFEQKGFLEKNTPNRNFPIVQSYIDICINGYLELLAKYPFLEKEKFVQKFINETRFWNEYWVNDRIYPRRPFIHCPNAYKIDSLLIDNLKDTSLFNKIYFE